MKAKVSRKYDVLTKFLKQIITSSKNERLRMAAAERLDGIYARHEQYEQQALQRRHRAELKALAVQAPQGTADDHEQETELTEAEKVKADLDKFLSMARVGVEPLPDAD